VSKQRAAIEDGAARRLERNVRGVDREVRDHAVLTTTRDDGTSSPPHRSCVGSGHRVGDRYTRRRRSDSDGNLSVAPVRPARPVEFRRHRSRTTCREIARVCNDDVASRNVRMQPFLSNGARASCRTSSNRDGVGRGAESSPAPRLRRSTRARYFAADGVRAARRPAWPAHQLR
jgi:hypothetical protein